LIISASRRTDIPAFYSDWFVKRLEAGFLYVKNPMNRLQVTRLDLSPEAVDCIVFWTKNAEPMLDKLDHFKNYPYYFQFTITPYDALIERGLHPRKKIIETFIRLSDIIGPERIIWRYDPVFFTPVFDMKMHLEVFEIIARKLSGYTDTCMFSYLTSYNKCKKNMQQIKYFIPAIDDAVAFALKLSSIAQAHNINLKSCASTPAFSVAGISTGRCVDPELINKITGYKNFYPKDPSQREFCGCAASVDIGAYNTCSHGCIYCYANYDHDQAFRNFKSHNSSSELLYGTLSGDETIRARKTRSSQRKSAQMEMF